MELKDMNVAELTGTILFSSMLDDDADLALKELLRRFGELQKQVEDMKCCFNCKDKTIDEYDGRFYCLLDDRFCSDKGNRCDKWQINK